MIVYDWSVSNIFLNINSNRIKYDTYLLLKRSCENIMCCNNRIICVELNNIEQRIKNLLQRTGAIEFLGSMFVVIIVLEKHEALNMVMEGWLY